MAINKIYPKVYRVYCSESRRKTVSHYAVQIGAECLGIIVIWLDNSLREQCEGDRLRHRA